MAKVRVRVSGVLGCSAALAVGGRPAATRKVARGVDQSQMAQCLRKVAEHSLISRIISFGQKTDVIAETQETLKQPARIFLTSQQGEIVG